MNTNQDSNLEFCKPYERQLYCSNKKNQKNKSNRAHVLAIYKQLNMLFKEALKRNPPNYFVHHSEKYMCTSTSLGGDIYITHPVITYMDITLTILPCINPQYTATLSLTKGDIKIGDITSFYKIKYDYLPYDTSDYKDKSWLLLANAEEKNLSKYDKLDETGVKRIISYIIRNNTTLED